MAQVRGFKGWDSDKGQVGKQPQASGRSKKRTGEEKNNPDLLCFSWARKSNSKSLKSNCLQCSMRGSSSGRGPQLTGYIPDSAVRTFQHSFLSPSQLPSKISRHHDSLLQMKKLRLIGVKLCAHRANEKWTWTWIWFYLTTCQDSCKILPAYGTTPHSPPRSLPEKAFLTSRPLPSWRSYSHGISTSTSSSFDTACNCSVC